jgi:hypothetical protein
MPESLGRREPKNLPLGRPFNSETAERDGAVEELAVLPGNTLEERRFSAA